MQLPLLPCYHVLTRSTYSPQQPILKRPQPMILPRCERPFTPIQNNRRNYNTVNLNLYIFGRQRIVHQMITKISLSTSSCIIKLKEKKLLFFSYITTSCCILISTHDQVLSFISIYLQLKFFYQQPLKFLCSSLQYVFFHPIHQHHYKLEADVYHLISSHSGLPEHS